MFDPKDYPHRPDHPDFWRLSELVLQMDGRAIEDPARAQKMVADIIDPHTLAYMATQRAMLLLGVQTQQQAAPRRTEIMRLASVYYESFILGARYQARYNKKDADR